MLFGSRQEVHRYRYRFRGGGAQFAAWAASGGRSDERVPALSLALALCHHAIVIVIAVVIVIVGSRTQGCLPVLAPRGAIVIVTGLRRGNGARRAVRGGAVVIWNVAAHLLRLR